MENGFCPGWYLSGMGYVRDGFCPEWVMSGMGYVTQSTDCRNPLLSGETAGESPGETPGIPSREYLLQRNLWINSSYDHRSATYPLTLTRKLYSKCMD